MSYKYGDRIVSIKDTNGHIPYYWGCHFSNDLLYGKTRDEKDAYMKNKTKQQNNAEFVGYMLMATSTIHAGQDIFTHYENIGKSK